MHRGYKFKTRRRGPIKPAGPKRNWEHAIDTLLLTRYTEAYIESMIVLGNSQRTATSRRIMIRRFIVWAHERGLSDPREITKPILERYQRHLFYYRKADGMPLTTGSQINLLRSIKAFFKWLTRQNHILYNPASELETPKRQKQLPRGILTVAEVEAMLNEAEPSNIMGLRDRALLELLYSTGIRRMEAAQLTCHDVDLTRGLVFVREGKGKRDRVVPIGERALAWLEKYLLEARPQLGPLDDSSLFVTNYGEQANGYFIASRVRLYKEFAGITKVGATHLLRHACATHMLEGGADIRFIQALLGHADMKTTEIYTHVSIEKLKSVHAATHPARLARAGDDEEQEAKAKYQPTQEEAKEALLEALANEDEEAA